VRCRCSAKPLWRDAHVNRKMWKTHHVRITFGRSSVVLCGRRNGFCTLRKVSKTRGFCSNCKNDGRRGMLEGDLQRLISVDFDTRDIFIKDVGWLGR
jgi:hypothetical protein